MAEPRKTRLLLVDYHRLVREGIRSEPGETPRHKNHRRGGQREGSVRKCRELKPDVVLMDLNMPEMSGLEATPLIRVASPATKIIALTVHDLKDTCRSYCGRTRRDMC